MTFLFIKSKVILTSFLKKYFSAISAEEYSSFFLSSTAAFSTSLTLNGLLTLWCSRQTALFLFLLAKTALAYLPTALSMALRLHFSSQQAQYAQAFPLKPAPSGKLLGGLGSTNKSATSLFLSDSRSVLSSIFPFVSIFLTDLAGTVFSLLFLSGHNGSPDTCFSRATTRPMSWPDGECYSCSHQSFVFSLLLSLVSILLFSPTGGVLSHGSSFTHRFPQFPPRNLCSPSHSLCSLSSSLQRTQPAVKLLSL